MFKLSNQKSFTLTKLLVVIAIFGILGTVIYVLIPKTTVKANPEQLSGFDYRKKITISNTASSQTNYQMELTINKGSGTDGGDSVYLNDHVQDDFDDIRFTKSDGTTLLDYWREDYTSGVNSTVWIEFDSLAASASTTFFIYYSSSTASSASSGGNTFLFFDDFDDNSFDSSKWVVKWGQSGNVHEQNQRIEIDQAIDITDAVVQTNTFTQARPFAIDYDITPISGGSSAWVLGFLYTGTAGSNKYRLIYHNTNGYDLRKDGVSVDGYTAGSLTEGTEYKAKIEITSSNIILSIDDNQIHSWSESTYDNLKLGFGRENWEKLYLDNFRVRKYASPTPTWGTWGSEESVVVAPTVTTQAASNILTTSATGNGNITATGGENAGGRGFEWGTASGLYTSTTTDYGSHGTGAFTYNFSNLTADQTHYYRAYATNTAGIGYGGEQSFTTKYYKSPGYATSTNLLSGETVSSIDSFDYTASAIPSGTTLKVQFSEDNTDWYDSSGNLGQWNTMSSNGSKNISLSALNWSSANFYYKVEFTSTGSNTVVLDEIAINYTSLNSCSINQSDGSCDAKAAGSDPGGTSLSCSVTTGSCSNTTVFRISATSNAHAELPSQANYNYYVCCSGPTGLGTSCSGNYDTCLKLSGTSNAHGEKKTEANYANSACLSTTENTISCSYATDCSSLGSHYTCLASISGNTNAHVGDCNAYSTKVCCAKACP